MRIIYKKVFVLSITILISLTACKKSVSNTTWEGKDSQGKNIVLIFHNDNKASLSRYLGDNNKTSYYDYVYDHPIISLRSMSDYNFIGLLENNSMILTFSTSSAIVLDGKVLGTLTKSK